MRRFIRMRNDDNIFQNLLFYYENESSSRPSGVILLEGCYCDRLIAAKGKDKDKQVEKNVIR